MKKHLKYVSLVLVLLSISVFASGCSTRKTAEVEQKIFTIWAFDDEDVWKPIIRDVQKELKGYEVKYVKKELNENYENDALNSILSGSGPDVWAVPNDWVYRHKDKLVPMPDKLAQEINVEELFVPAIKQNCVIDNQIYSLSPTVDTLMIYYNQTLFDSASDDFNSSHKGTAFSEERKRVNKILSEVPITWNDFSEAVKLINIRQNDNFVRSGVALGTAKNTSEATDILYALMLQNGTDMTSDDLKTATFNLPVSTSAGNEDNPAKRALDFYLSFSDPNSPNYSWNENMGSDIEAFVNNKVAMIFGYESLSNYFAQLFPSFRYRKAPLPQIGDTDTNISDYASYNTFVVPSLSQNSEAAWSTIINLSIDNASSYSSTIKISSSAKSKSYEPSLADRSGVSNPGRYQTQQAKVWNKGRFPKLTDDIIKDVVIGNSLNKSQNSLEALNLGASQQTTLLRKEDW